MERTQLRRDHAEEAAWRIADEIAVVRRYYTDALHRTERLQKRIGEQLLTTYTEATRDSM
jgi:hypothetical protein